MNKQEKLNKIFAVKSSNDDSVKDVDLSRRHVEMNWNTYFFIDSDYDMLVPGAAKKSINDKGPDSEAGWKIKHQKDHFIGTDYQIGIVKELEEVRQNNNYFIRAVSKIPQTTKGNDYLINYQEGLFDQHSIGFIYRDLAFAGKESEFETERENWEKYYPLALNPEKADKDGFFFIVKEIELWEGSVVTFGANQLTPFLGVKGENKENIKLKLYNRIDILQKQLRTGKQSDEMMKNFELNILQIKQIISDLVEPLSKMDTLKEPFKKDNTLNYELILQQLENGS